MTTSQPRVLLRAQVGMSWVYRVFNILFALLFCGIFLLITVFNTDTLYNYSWYLLFAAAACGLLVLVLAYLIIQLLPKTPPWAEPVAIGVLFAGFVALQVFVGMGLAAQPDTSWGFGQVFEAARDYVLQGTQPGEYLQMFPGETGLYTVWMGYFNVLRQIGITNFTLPAMCLNILAMDVSLLLLYLSTRTLFGKKRALFVLFMSFITLAFLCYVPVYYVDTLSMLFPIAMVYTWLRGRRYWRQAQPGKAIGRFCAVSVLAGLGSFLKLSVLVVWVAIAIDVLLSLAGKGRWKLLLAGLPIVAVLTAGGIWLLRYSGIILQNRPGLALPLIYYVMAGLSYSGTATAADAEVVLAAMANDSHAVYYSTVQARLADMGIMGVLLHLGDKLSFTFGDGGYLFGGILGQSAQPNIFQEIFTKNGEIYWVTAYTAFGIHAATLAGVIIGSIKAVLRRNDCLSFVRMALFGLVLFLLVWETSPRYLVTFLPLILLCAVEALPVDKKKKLQSKKSPQKKAAAKKAPLPGPMEVTVSEAMAELEPTASAPSAANAVPGGDEAQPLVAQPAESDLFAKDIAQPDKQLSQTKQWADEPPRPATTPQQDALFEQLMDMGQAKLPSELLAQPGEGEDDVHYPGQGEDVELFDVPKGDPFWEFAHTSQWSVEEVAQGVREREEGRANAGPEQETDIFYGGAQPDDILPSQPQAYEDDGDNEALESVWDFE